MDSDEELFDDESQENVESSNDSGSSDMKRTKQRAGVWKHFEEILENDVKYARCIHCHKRYKISGTAKGSTGNMNNHLASKHPDKVDRPDEQENSAFIFSQENFRKALLEWMITTDQPFTAPQQLGFKGMVKMLNPEAKLYSDKTMRADLLDTFREKFIELKERVTRIPGKMAITMDGWTSKNFLPFLAIRAHWLDEEWNYRSQILDFPHIEGSHSGETFKDLFLNALKSLEIPLDKIISITVDNASSNDTFFDELEEIFDVLADEQHIRCLAHIINLAAQDVLNSLKNFTVNSDEDAPLEDDLANEDLDDIDLEEDIEELEEDEWLNDEVGDGKIVVKLRTLVRKIRKSVLLRQKLNKLCAMYNVKYLVPIIDVKTRWNSTYLMIDRVEYLKTPLKVLCANEKSLASFRITDCEWLDLIEVKHLLQKFHRATQLVSMERHSTIHAYLPTLDWLIVTLKSIVRGPSSLVHAAKAGLQKLQKYEEIIQSSKIPFIAVFLNPALKLNYFKEHKYHPSKTRDIKKMISEYFSENYDNDEPMSEEEEIGNRDGEDELYKHMYKRSKKDKVSSEIQKYLNLDLESPDVQVLQYWKSSHIKSSFPKLSKMARDILPVQPSSVAVERDFSKGTRVVRPQRASLITETIRASMFMKSWYENNNL